MRKWVGRVDCSIETSIVGGQQRVAHWTGGPDLNNILLFTMNTDVLQSMANLPRLQQFIGRKQPVQNYGFSISADLYGEIPERA